MKWAKGDTLSPEMQAEVLHKFVHRYTGDHTPQWVNDDPRFNLQFKDDNDWLANTTFAVTLDGKLDKRLKYCTSNPTWPNGKHQ